MDDLIKRVSAYRNEIVVDILAIGETVRHPDYPEGVLFIEAMMERIDDIDVFIESCGYKLNTPQGGAS